MDRIGSPCFQFGLAATLTIVWLFIVLFAQHVSHRRKEEISGDAIADVLRHDAYSREKAREAIRRYNDHIEACNRVIEAEDSGASRWVSSAHPETLQSELGQYRSEAAALREETKRLRDECEKHKATVAELSQPSRIDDQPGLPFANDPRTAELVTRINELQDELIAE
jgi:thiamine biosynthesis lipoprotein ApbE